VLMTFFSVGNSRSVLWLANFRVVTVVGLFHFWDVMRGYVEAYSLWLSKFYFPMPRIESSSEFVDIDFTEMSWQNMIHGSGFNPFRHFSLGFDDN
jgi:hypothetical protein